MLVPSFGRRPLSRRGLLALAPGVLSAAGLGLLAACGGTASVAATGSTGGSASALVSTSIAPATSTAAITSSSVAASPASVAALSTTAKASTSSSASAAGVPAAAGASGKGLTLTVSSWLTDQPMKEAYAHLIAAYAKVQPDIKVVQQPIPGDYETAVTTLFAGGTPPDLAESNWGDSQTWGVKKAIVPLDPMIQQDKINIADYVQVAQELGRWPQKTGSYYAWYTMFATSPLFYNTALFRTVGLQPPDETWTWHTLLEAAQK
ncbi:MAG TPA: extracellular solute-binding protein, partial [Chloroflexota bacterium]